MKNLHTGLSRFFRWWLGELTDCLPSRLRSAFAHRYSGVVIAFADGKAVFELAKGKARTSLGHLDLRQDSVDNQRSAARKIVKRAARRTEVVLQLPRNKVLRRIINLPSAALENLREVLAFEMDRHTPFKAQEVYYDYQTLTNDRDSKWVKVELTVVAKETVDQFVQLVESWGLTPSRVAVTEASSDEEEGRPLDLLPQMSPHNERKSGRRLTGLWALVVCALLVVAIFLPLRNQQAVLAMTEGRLTKVQEDAVAADALQQQVATMIERSHFVAQERREIPTIMQLMKEASVLLPDHTWILHFGWNGERLTLAGYSAEPSSLIRRLEKSDALSEVRFTSAVTADPKIERERFRLSAMVSRRGDD